MKNTIENSEKADASKLKEKEDISTAINSLEIIDLINLLWGKKWFVIRVVLVFVVLGIIYAFTAPKEYVTSATLISEAPTEGQIGGSISGLASLAGLDLGGVSGGSQTINPALYETVSKSTLFLLKLMEQNYFFSDIGEEISIHDYYMEHFKTDLLNKVLSAPFQLINLLKGDDVDSTATLNNNIAAISLTEDEEKIIEDLRTRIFVDIDWELNLVTVQVKMQDPIVAAQMVDFTKDYITNYVTEYAISKSQQQLESIEKQYSERKDDFEAAQMRLAAFRDKNINVTAALVKSEEQRLQSDFDLAFSIYSQIAKQREAIKLQIQDKTPVFSVLEPAIIPIDESEPKKLIILIGSVFIGLALSFLKIILEFVLPLIRISKA